MDSALIYGKKSPEYSHGDLHLSLTHTLLQTTTRSLRVRTRSLTPSEVTAVTLLHVSPESAKTERGAE